MVFGYFMTSHAIEISLALISEDFSRVVCRAVYMHTVHTPHTHAYYEGMHMCVAHIVLRKRFSH